jgi:hypothetical protein
MNDDKVLDDLHLYELTKTKLSLEIPTDQSYNNVDL